MHSSTLLLSVNLRVPTARRLLSAALLIKSARLPRPTPHSLPDAAAAVAKRVERTLLQQHATPRLVGLLNLNSTQAPAVRVGGRLEARGH